MAILEKKIKGHSYFYEVRGYRENGKVRQKIVQYFGRTDPRKNPEAKPIIKKELAATYRFGDVALLYKAAERIDLIDTVNRYVSKRQGLSLGLEFFMTAAHKLLDDNPSSHNLSKWVRTTHLPILLNFDPGRITDNTQQYLMHKIYDEDANIDHIYRISIDLYRSALRLFGKEDDTYFYDITSTYFEGKCCPIAFFGHNKDGKLDKLQINIAMIMNGSYGIPVVSKVFRGNINDARTLFEMVYYPRAVMKKEKCLLIMDRGFDSEDNIRLMDTTRYDYIIGLSAKHRFVKEMKRRTDFSVGEWETIEEKGQVVKLAKSTKNLYGKRRTAILYYSQKVAEEQRLRREFRIENALKRLDDQRELSMKKGMEITMRVRKYVIVEQVGQEVKWRVDKVAINRAKRDDGKFCLLTNLDMAANEVFRTYFSKDKIEKGFRHMKQDANLRPIYKRLADNVIVDVFACHVAYLLLRVAEHLAQKEKINGFWNDLSSEAREVRIVEMRTPHREGASFQIVTNNEVQRDIVDRLNLAAQVPVYSTTGKTSSET